MPHSTCLRRTPLYVVAECPPDLPSGTVERGDTGDCYFSKLTNNDEKTYDDAQADCETYGMSLASLRSADEYDWFRAQFETSTAWEFIWLSAREEVGPWMWLGQYSHERLYVLSLVDASYLIKPPPPQPLCTVLLVIFSKS